MRFAVIVAVTLLLAAFACGEELTPTAGPKATSAPASPATTPAPGSNPALGSEALTASSDIRSFQLQDLVVQLGTTVTWTNTAGASHTTTSGQPGGADAGEVWDSGSVRSARTFSHTFTQVGQFPYFCKIHPTAMMAVVTVVENLDEQSSSPPATSTPKPGSIYDY